MKGFLAAVHMLANGLAYIQPLDAVDPGFGGGGFVPVDPGYGQGHPGGRPDNELPGQGGHPWWGGRPDRPDAGLPGHGHPGNALPIAPVRPSPPITLPPGMWPPS